VDSALRELDGDFFQALVDPQGQLTPGAPTAQAVLPGVPLSRALDPEAHGINRDMPRATLRRHRRADW